MIHVPYLHCLVLYIVNQWAYSNCINGVPNDVQSRLQPQASRPEGPADPLAFNAMDRMNEASILSNTTGWNSGTAFPWDRATGYRGLPRGASLGEFLLSSRTTICLENSVISP